LRNATPSVLHQRHIGRVLRSSCKRRPWRWPRVTGFLAGLHGDDAFERDLISPLRLHGVDLQRERRRKAA
jgi:hypothetical protein